MSKFFNLPGKVRTNKLSLPLNLEINITSFQYAQNICFNRLFSYPPPPGPSPVVDVSNVLKIN